MDSHPYHHYLFFDVDKLFYVQTAAQRAALTAGFAKLLGSSKDLIIETYSTLGLKPKTSFMLWVRGPAPEAVPDLMRAIKHSDFGQYIELTYSYFGIARPSTYSGRHGKPEQTMQNFSDRLPYLIVYPFTKTTDWHQLEFADRRQIMGEHVKVGIGHPSIRQCLLYAYGIDDYEFVVAYETADLEKFQDLVIDMRHTRSRLYTASDVPIFTCIYRPLEEIRQWL